MSASAKKKLRKEENAAQLTEKQLAEQKEAKKLKLYTTIFVVAIVVVLVAGLIIAGFNFVKNSGIKEKNTVAAVIGDHEINAVEMSYYYTDTLDSNYKNWANTYGDSMTLYLSLMGLDLTQPLSAQTYSDGTTWADYFVDIALSAAQRDYLMAALASKIWRTFTNSPRRTVSERLISGRWRRCGRSWRNGVCWNPSG